MTRRTAGPTLRALAAAGIGRVIIQAQATTDAIADYSRSGNYRDEIHGVKLATSNVITVDVPDVESRFTWEITHPFWTLKFTERRRLSDEGSFVKSAPYEVILEGDLVDAARFLRLPRELFFEAVRADGWTATEATIERLRWLDMPYVTDDQSLKVVMKLL